MSTPSTFADLFSDSIRNHVAVVTQLEQHKEAFLRIATRLTETIRSGGKILWCGNGGSAADAQHMAAEFVGRFRNERPGWASIAVTTDTSILTAIANDYGFDTVFARQVQALGHPGDVLAAFSTSGNSANVLKAVQAARSMGAFTVGFTGEDGGKLRALVDECFCVPSQDTARIQECHILIGHMLCDYVERQLLG
jgi:D-sedoheptulose 7-phosphate isomerase